MTYLGTNDCQDQGSSMILSVSENQFSNQVFAKATTEPDH